MLETPEKIRELQRKLYQKAKQENCESHWKKMTGKPYSRKLNVRFEEGELEIGHSYYASSLLYHEWYREYPFLQAIQVYERLKSYGFTGGYTAVKEYTQPFRKKKRKKAYHELVFLPGQEAQGDWMQRTLPLGVVYGFVYILAFSRYLYVRFF